MNIDIQSDAQFDMEFEEMDQHFDLEFNEIQSTSDGGFERGYEAGYSAGEKAGNAAGYEKGQEEGRAEGYSDGYADGDAAGHERGHADGIQSEYDRFWDEYQYNGTRKKYAGAFAGEGWVAENLKPKYDIICESTNSYMFQYSNFAGDLVKLFDDLDIKFDLSKATALHSLFNSALYITHVGVIDITGAGAATSMLFGYCFALKTIDKLVLNETNTPNSWFQQATGLENLTIEGTIAKNGFDIHWSTKLSKASITSIINALSATTSGLSIMLSKAAVNTAFETSAGAADGSTSAEYAALKATKSNWTINLS